MRQKPVPFAALNFIEATDEQLADDQDVIIPVDIISENRSRRATLAQIRGTSATPPPATLGFPMNWAGLWTQQTYFKGDTVRDYHWLMVANKDTATRPAPQSAGPEFYSMPDEAVWSTQNDPGWVATGNKFTISRSIKVNGYRIYVPTRTADYSLYTYSRIFNPIDNSYEEGINPVTTIYQGGGWYEVNIAPRWIIAGMEIEVGLVMNNTLNETFFLDSQWVYDGDNKDDPPIGQWARDKDKEIRIHITDDNSVNQSSALASLVVGDVIDFVGTTSLSHRRYAIDVAKGLVGSHYEFDVSRTLNDGNFDTDEITNIKVSRPGAVTDYGELAGFWGGSTPAWASAAAGVIVLDEGGVPVTNTNGYGADLLIEDFNFSPDWDLMSLGNF